MFRKCVARQLIRKTGGGSQARLIRTDGEEFFITKFSNNPQGERVLINEAVGTVLLSHLGVAVPEPALILVPPEVLGPDFYFESSGTRRIPLQAGLHFGSRYPGHPNRVAVHDYLPDPFLPKVANVSDFLGALVFDKWVSNSDKRQAVFCRSKGVFRAYMIDQGYVFSGLDWCLRDAPLQGLYPFPVVYAGVHSLDDFEPWLHRARHMPVSLIEQVYQAIPEEWISESSRTELECLLENLYRRQSRIADLLLDCRQARPSLFPNWTRLGRPMARCTQPVLPCRTGYCGVAW